MPIKLYSEFAFDFRFHENRGTKNSIYDCTSQLVFITDSNASHCRPSTACDRLIIAGHVSHILRVHVLETANSAYTHRIKIAAGFRRITLKVAMKSSLVLCTHDFIFRSRKVVEADVSIAGFGQQFDRSAKD